MDVSAETLQAFLDDAWETSGANAGLGDAKPFFTGGVFGLAGVLNVTGLTTGARYYWAQGNATSFDSFISGFVLTASGFFTADAPNMYMVGTQNVTWTGTIYSLDSGLPAPALRNQLRAYEKASEALFRGGSIASVSKNSASQSYRGPGLGSYTPVQLANAWRQLISLYDQVFACVNAELAQHPAANAVGTVLTSGQTVAVFSAGGGIGFVPGQIVSVRQALDSLFNLAGTPVVTVPAAGSFTYAVATNPAPLSDAAVVFYNANPCLPPDNSDGSVYQLMRRRLAVVLSAGTDMSDLRLPSTTAFGKGLFSW